MNRRAATLASTIVLLAAACSNPPAAAPSPSASAAPADAAPEIASAAPATPPTASAAPATPAPDEYDALARKIVDAKTHAAWSPSAHAVAYLRCVEEEGAGSECRLVTADVSTREDDLAQGLVLWQIGQDPRVEAPKVLPKVAAELRAKKYVGVPRVEWKEPSKPLDVPGIGAFSVRGDTLRSPRPKGKPLETPLEKQIAPHKNIPSAVFAAPDAPFALVEISADPGDKYGQGFNAHSYVRVVPVGPGADEPAPTPVKSVEQGKSYFAVYLDVGRPGDAALKKSFDAAKAKGWSPSTGELRCDRGAVEALGVDPAVHATSVYFTSEADARRFAELLRPKAWGVVKVTVGCAD